MAVKINSETKKDIIPKSLERILPYRLSDEIRRIGTALTAIEEIRLRLERAASLTVGGENIILSTVLSRRELDDFLSAICEGSLYAHSDTINKGYITLEDGIRVGICGRASLDGDKVIGVYDVTAMNIRIPRKILSVGEPICELLRSLDGARGVLVYSPPGEGKTTLLRAVAERMARGKRPLRVCLIDTRGELSFSLSDKEACIDILSGYPRSLGIEIAIRTMNAELIVCDEIGEAEEARAMVLAGNAGVPFLASAHSCEVSELIKRPTVRPLHEAGIFGAYVGIKRKNRDFIYTVSSWEEANAFLQDSGRSDSACLGSGVRKPS